MTKTPGSCLVILAGGQSTRMGSDKAIVRFAGQRLIDILIGRFAGRAERILLSAREDYDSGLQIISDDPAAPSGPVGGIFSVAAALPEMQPGTVGFVTVPVDAPHAPADLIERLSASGTCAVARGPQRIHPTFAYWHCETVNQVRAARAPGGKAPSLHWLTEQCAAISVAWPDERPFMNINRPADLVAAQATKKAGA
jgi:molybdopterin-guanine dinucleotide biosynthesis protein A